MNNFCADRDGFVPHAVDFPPTAALAFDGPERHESVPADLIAQREQFPPPPASHVCCEL